MFRPAWEGQPLSLGFLVLEWMEEYLTAPDRNDGSPFIPTLEQAEFIVAFYALAPNARRRAIRRAVISRSKGWGKSPLLAAIMAAEALAEVVPDGFDASGQPVGRPWWTVRTPLLQSLAVSEDQTMNAWTPMLEMMSNDRIIDAYPGLDPMQTFISLPLGRIERVTAAAASREGNPVVFAVLDQTESWVKSNGGVRLSNVVRRNVGKTGGTTIEAPNAFLPGEGSVAEASAKAWDLQKRGKTREEGLLYDHREGTVKDLSDRLALREALRVAYGCSSSEPCGLPGHDHGPGWVDLDRIISEIYDVDTDPQDARRYYLNQITHAADSFISAPEWTACLDADLTLKPGDIITLGFDGSMGRAKGVADSTGLIAARLSDGALFKLGAWEQPDGPAGEGWQPPIAEVDAVVDEAFRLYKVAAFYCDPARWQTRVNAWEAKYSKQLVKSKAGKRLFVKPDHPFEWWMSRTILFERAVKAFAASIRAEEVRHTGDPALTRHMLNARRRIVHGRLSIGKDSPESINKIDLAIAATLAWQGRMDAISAGISTTTARAVRRIR